MTFLNHYIHINLVFNVSLLTVRLLGLDAVVQTVDQLSLVSSLVQGAGVSFHPTPSPSPSSSVQDSTVTVPSPLPPLSWRWRVVVRSWFSQVSPLRHRGQFPSVVVDGVALTLGPLAEVLQPLPRPGVALCPLALPGQGV